MKNRKKLHLSTQAKNGNRASAHTEAHTFDTQTSEYIIEQISEIVQSSRKKLLQLLEVEDIPPEGNTLTTYVFFDKERRKPTLYNPSMEDDPSYTHISFSPIVVDFSNGNPLQIIKRIAYKIDIAPWTKLAWAIDLDMPEDDDDAKQSKLFKVLDYFKNLNLMPSAIVKTSKGYHLLWILEERYEIKDKEKWLSYSSLLDQVTLILRKTFPFIDKSLHKGYIRLPSQDNDFTLYEHRYTIADIEKRLSETFKSELVKLRSLDFDRKEDFLPISYKDIERALTDCHHLKKLMETFKDHTYKHWFMALRALVNLYLLAPEEEKPKIRELIHQLSSQHPTYTYAETEYMINYLERTGFIPVLCKTLVDYVEGDVEDCKKHCKLYKITKEEVLIKLSPYLNGRQVKEVVLEERIGRNVYKVTYDGNYYYLTIEDKKGTPIVKNQPILPAIEIERILSYPSPEGKHQIIIYVNCSNIHGSKVRLDLPEPVTTQDKEQFFKALLSANVIDATPRKEIREIIIQIFNKLIAKHRREHGSKEGELNPKNVDLKSFLGEEMVYDPFKLKFTTIPEDVLRLLVDKKLAGNVVYDKKGDAFVYFHRLSELVEKDPWAKYLIGALALPLHHRQFHGLPTLSGNPVILILGNAGTGKTLRVETLMSLWCRGINDPTARAYQLTGTSFLSEPFLAYVLPFFQIPVMLDDMEYVELKNKSFDISSLIKTLFNASHSPIRFTASKNYQSKIFRSTFLITIEPTHSIALAKDQEEKTGTARRIITFTIPDRRRQSKITGKDFNTLIDEWVKFRDGVTREHYGFISDYYACLEENIDRKFYEELIQELKKYKLETTYLITLALIVFHTYHFSRFLNEQYQADIKLFLPNISGLSLSKAKPRDFIEEFQHITENTFEPWEEEEEEELVSNLLANAKIILTGDLKAILMDRPLNADTVRQRLNNGSKHDKQLCYILFGQIQKRGDKPRVKFNSFHAPLSLFYHDVRTNHQNNAYTRCIEALEHNIDMLLNHKYFEGLRQYLTITIQAPKNKREMERELRLYIYKLYIHLLLEYAPAQLEPFMKALSDKDTSLFIELQGYYRELTGTEAPKGPSTDKDNITDMYTQQQAVENVKKTLEALENGPSPTNDNKEYKPPEDTTYIDPKTELPF